MEGIKRIVKFIICIERYLVVLFLSIIVTSVILGVFFRYVLRSPLDWSMEFTLICFPWLVFLGASLVISSDSHVRLEIFTQYLSNKVLFYLNQTVDFITLFVLCILIYFGFKHSIDNYQLTTTILRLSWSYIFLSIPVGSIFMSIHVLDIIFDRFKKFNLLTRRAEYHRLDPRVSTK